MWQWFISTSPLNTAHSHHRKQSPSTCRHRLDYGTGCCPSHYTVRPPSTNKVHSAYFAIGSVADESALGELGGFPVHVETVLLASFVRDNPIAQVGRALLCQGIHSRPKSREKAYTDSAPKALSRNEYCYLPYASTAYSGKGAPSEHTSCPVNPTP